VDYRGRQYSVIKGESGLTLLGAYDEHGKPLKPNGQSIEGKQVKLDRLKTKADAALEAHGIKGDPIIRLVQKGVKTTNTSRGEEYTEEKDGRTIQVSASRLQITFPDSGQSWGMLVSEIDLVAGDQEEVERLKVAKWRIEDSISEMRKQRKVSGEDQPVEIADGRIEEMQFDDGEMSFVLYHGSEDSPVRTEYYFSTQHGSSRKDYAKAGKDWVAMRVPNQELDGTVPLNAISAARTIDKFRYQIVKPQ